MPKMLSKMTTVLAAAAAVGLTAAGVASADTDGSAGWYNDAGFGACGTEINASTDFLVAAPAALWTAPNLHSGSRKLPFAGSWPIVATSTCVFENYCA